MDYIDEMLTTQLGMSVGMGNPCGYGYIPMVGAGVGLEAGTQGQTLTHLVGLGKYCGYPCGYGLYLQISSGLPTAWIDFRKHFRSTLTRYYSFQVQ
jgi:hypothetical protein